MDVLRDNIIQLQQQERETVLIDRLCEFVIVMNEYTYKRSTTERREFSRYTFNFT